MLKPHCDLCGHEIVDAYTDMVEITFRKPCGSGFWDESTLQFHKDCQPVVASQKHVSNGVKVIEWPFYKSTNLHFDPHQPTPERR